MKRSAPYICILMSSTKRFLTAEFLGEFRQMAENYADDPPRIVAHFHEWMAGIGLIMARVWKVS